LLVVMTRFVSRTRLLAGECVPLNCVLPFETGNVQGWPEPYPYNVYD